MTPTFLRVNLGERSYDIVMAHQSIDGAGAFARQRVQGNKAFVVTDANVVKHAQVAAASLNRVGFETELSIRPAGEGQKSLTAAAELYDRLVECHADRRTLVVAVGGGVIGDLAGFVAAPFKRGLPPLMVPTTLLAMVDSSVGGKVGINHPKAKNLIGAFHQPVGVWIDTATLATLPEREYRSGLAEVVKYGVILDVDFFAFLEANADGVLLRDGAAVREIVRRVWPVQAAFGERGQREPA